MKPSDAIQIFLRQYEKSNRIKSVDKPISLALYQTWKIVSNEEIPRPINADKPNK